MSEIVIRPAKPSDAEAVARAVTALLVELSGRPEAKLRPGWAAVFDALVSDPARGAIFVADAADGSLAGVLTLTLGEALRTGGRYATIQELWVDGTRRSGEVGAQLIQAAVDFCAAQRITDIEVGLPSARFPDLARTAAFYRRMAFTEIGMRMRRILPS